MSAVRARSLSVVAALLLLSAGLLHAPPAEASPGDLVAKVTVPVPGSVGVSFAFDGTTFYYTNLGDPTLYGYALACAGAACASTLTLAQPLVLGSTGGPSQEIDAMAYDGVRDQLWGASNGVVFEVDPATGVVTPAFSISAACSVLNLVDGLAYDGLEDAFWFSSDAAFSVCKVSAATGALLGVFDVSTLGFPEGCYNSGLAVGGDFLYLGTNGCGQIVRLDKATFTTVDVFASPGGRDEDMECDPLTFAPRSVIWSKDAYDNTVSAFEIESGTCGLGGLSACVDETGVAITRPAPNTRYENGVAHPWGQPTPLVSGDLTLEASVADPSLVASVTWRVDGAILATGGPAPTYAATWPASAAAPGLHFIAASFHGHDGRCVGYAARAVAVPTFTEEAIARAVFVTTSHPAESIVTSPGASGAMGTGEHKLLDHREDAVGLRVESLHDQASHHEDGTGGHAVSTLQRVSLLNGRIQAEVLRAEATVSLDASTFATTASADGSLVAGLVVDGTPIPVTAPNTVVQIPGVGRLVLLETIDRDLDGHRELRVNALHLYLAPNGLRAEVVLGQAIAGADVSTLRFTGQDQEILADDDAGTGGDVGDSPASAHPLALAPAPGAGAIVLGGRLSNGDASDWYSFALAEGQKVVATVKPAEVAEVRTATGTIPDNPAFASLHRASAETDLTLQLVAPNGSVVLTSAAPLTLPERIELNADADGTWTLGILGGGTATNYTLALSVTPIHLVDEVAAPAACGAPGAPLLERGAAILDAMRSDDRHRVFRLHADLGDDLTVTLHPLDGDGADFDLYLYDAACNLLSESTLGKSLLWSGDAPKGLPDVVHALPSLSTGDYWIEVRRVVGVGNYALAAQANTVLPTLPGNDANTGADASNDPSTPTPLFPNAGAWQGRFEDADPRDVYSFQIKAGQRAAITWTPSPANMGQMTLLDPLGHAIPLEAGNNAGRSAHALTHPAPADATWRIVLAPTLGGGNYLLTVAQA